MMAPVESESEQYEFKDPEASEGPEDWITSGDSFRDVYDAHSQAVEVGDSDIDGELGDPDNEEVPELMESSGDEANEESDDETEEKG